MAGVAESIRTLALVEVDPDALALMLPIKELSLVEAETDLFLFSLSLNEGVVEALRLAVGERDPPLEVIE
jgi:hypothetical protein